MQESHLRSLLKAISWRIFGTVMTILISYIITNQVSAAIYIGVFEFIAKVMFFYFHERLWAVIPFGMNHLKQKPFASL